MKAYTVAPHGFFFATGEQTRRLSHTMKALKMDHEIVKKMDHKVIKKMFHEIIRSASETAPS